MRTRTPVDWETRTREAIRARMVERDPGPSRDRGPLLIDVLDRDDGQRLDLPDAHLVDRVSLTGLLGLAWATIWCRENSPAHAGSPVPWDPAELQRWVVELHGMWPDRDKPEGPRLSVVFTAPCPVDPRIPSPEADAAIRWVITRALLHEGQEGTWIDGQHRDPHEIGEVGLKAVWPELYRDAHSLGGSGW